MANINFFARLGNLWKGFVSIWLEDAEKRNPAIAYQNSIDSMTEKFGRLRNASAAIIRRRQELKQRKEKREQELAAVRNQLEQAMATDQDDLGAILVQKEEQLVAELDQVTRDLTKAQSDADNAKNALLQVKAEIDNLKAEKDRMLAQFESASARTHINDQLEGLSVDAEIRALDNVRTHIKNKVAEADLNDELKANDLDTRLANLQQKGAGTVAANKFAAMKAAKAQQAAAGKSL